MDQDKSFQNYAKQILNNDNKLPYSDKEIKGIIQILESFVDIICNQK